MKGLSSMTLHLLQDTEKVINMKVLIMTFSVKGYETSKKIKNLWSGADITIKAKCERLGEISESGSVKDCVKEYFYDSDAIVFVGAAGIAVRSIAPFIENKHNDPAVVVIDEQCKFAVSLLSGHWGRANEITEKIAYLTGAVPVITTATDREGKFAVDTFARKNNMTICNWDMAKKISAAIIAGERKGIYSDIEIKGNMPPELYYTDDNEDIHISVYNKGKGLLIVPKAVRAGIGARKGVSCEEVERAVIQCFKENNVSIYALCDVASIDIKKDEKGIIDFARKYNADFVTYSAEELKSVKGEFSESGFVESVTGVSNVCERCAAAQGELISHKKAYGRVTVALSLKKERISFE